MKATMYQSSAKASEMGSTLCQEQFSVSLGAAAAAVLSAPLDSVEFSAAIGATSAVAPPKAQCIGEYIISLAFIANYKKAIKLRHENTIW
jgi:hypothetical protein